MSATASAIVQKVWNYAHILKDDGLAFMDYTEQITYLLFLKMAWERREEKGACRIPARYSWENLRKISNDKALSKRYHQAIRKLSEQGGLLGLIYTKPQSKINDPAKLRLLINMINEENWSALDMDVKGEIYEGLLAHNAEDVRGGAGQYFTPRPVIRAIVEVVNPEPTMVVADPACGTGGFLLAAYEWMRRRVKTATQGEFLEGEALRGSDIVPNVARLCAMNLYLHGLGAESKSLSVSIQDSLAKKPTAVDVVLTNPPFGKRSSVTIIGESKKRQDEQIYYDREDFWATTRNKQLNFVQHVWSMLKNTGRAAVVIPDNVLFESGAGELIRKNLLFRCEVHTLLRLPTGIWYSAGVKANVLFFDKKPVAKTPWTKSLWVYDLRTNKNFTQRENPITTDDLKDFIECYSPGNRGKRKETERFKQFTYRELGARDRMNLDIFWLRDDSVTDLSKLPSSSVIASQIIDDLKLALGEFGAVQEELDK